MFDRSAQLFGQEVAKPKSTRQTLARFWAYFREYKVALLLIVGSIMMTVAIQAAAPVLIGEAADCYLAIDEASFAESCLLFDTPPVDSAEKIRGLGGLVIVISLLYMLSSALSGLQFFNFARIGFKALHKMRLDKTSSRVIGLRILAWGLSEA